mgnify:FL=1
MPELLHFIVPIGDTAPRETSLDGCVGDDFLRNEEAWDVMGGSMTVRVHAVRDGNLCHVDVAMHGTVRVPCDRCLKAFDLPLSYKGQLVLQRAACHELSMDDELWEVPEHEDQVDIAPYIRESIYLSLPMRRYHGVEGTSESDCDPAMRARIDACQVHEGGIALGAQAGDMLRELRGSLCQRETE